MAQWANLAARVTRADLTLLGLRCYGGFAVEVPAELPELLRLPGEFRLDLSQIRIEHAQVTRRRLRSYAADDRSFANLYPADIRPGDVLLSPEVTGTLGNPTRRRVVVAAVFRNFGAEGAPFYIGCSDGSAVALDAGQRYKIRRQRLPADDGPSDEGAALFGVLQALWQLDDTAAARPTIDDVAAKITGAYADEHALTAGVAAGFAWNLVRLGDLSGRSQGWEKLVMWPRLPAVLRVGEASGRVKPDGRRDGLMLIGQLAMQSYIGGYIAPVHLLGTGAEYLPRGMMARAKDSNGQSRWTIADRRTQISITPAGRIWLLADCRLSGVELLEDALPTQPTPPPSQYTVNFHEQVHGSAFAVGDQASQVVHIENDSGARATAAALLEYLLLRRADLDLPAADGAELDESLTVLGEGAEGKQPVSALRLAGRTVYRLAGELLVGAAGNALWEAFKAAVGL
ncbi:hypothetical protein [Hamadaea tsunoensis]|uniref:hypothetical protein n=1 Tax=Hamadaea tsunoensis TaxID=53368 RepID=UPI000410EBC1|nr:hypothetical protein [Hamadaea tsunoensis]